MINNVQLWAIGLGYGTRRGRGTGNVELVFRQFESFDNKFEK